MDKKQWKKIRKHKDAYGRIAALTVFSGIVGAATAASTVAFNLHFYEKNRVVQLPNEYDATFITEPCNPVFEIRDTVRPLNELREAAQVQKELIEAKMATKKERKKKKERREKR